jgi:hypothetical protein
MESENLKFQSSLDVLDTAYTVDCVEFLLFLTKNLEILSEFFG